MDRKQAIQEFEAGAAFEGQVQTALRAIFEQKPRAVLIGWEHATGVGVTSVPFSVALVKGMMILLQELVDQEDEVEEEEEEGV